jgi:hypothetical protein
MWPEDEIELTALDNLNELDAVKLCWKKREG